MNYKKSIVQFLFLAIFALTACTNKKNTVVTRAYHNLTSRYNGLFNAEEAFKEGVKKIETSAKEDYSKVLPIFQYGTTADAKSVFPEMEKCFKKCSRVIEYHGIRIKGIEYCKWIDETYLLIGKSHLYKHDYFPALESFEFVTNEFKKNPNRYAAKLLMVQAYNELGNISAAEELLEDIKSDKKFPKKLFAKELAIVEADLYMRLKNNDPAITWLRKGLKVTKKKVERIRYTFILAQLFQEKGDNKKAEKYYGDVIKMRPKYEMAFNARLFKARCLETNAKNAGKIKKELIAMSKDGKNEEFKDQIFYTLALIELKDGNQKDAEFYFLKSIKSSTTNQKQKGESCNALAELYYNKTTYVKAQAFYDSAITFLPKNYSGYSIIENKRNNLSKLVAYIDTVSNNDSLIKLSNLSQKDRDVIIDKEIKKKIDNYYKQKEQAELKAKQAEDKANQPNTNLSNESMPGQALWYFYNPTTLSFGVTDFQKKWGQRKLEDNWRRKEKIANTNQGEEGVQVAALSEEELEKQVLDKIKERKQYENLIPKGDADFLKTHKSIENSLFNLGIIYEQQLDNHEKSAESFEELLQRYPNTSNKLTVYYQLYRIYTANNEPKKADKYKELLIKDDPNSEFSQLITNPNFNASAEGSKAKAAKLYEETYTKYKEEKYSDVVANAATAHQIYNNSELLPKFDYLRALASKRTIGNSEMEKYLKEILLKYPTDPIKNEAQNMLTLMGSVKNTNSSEAQINSKDSVPVIPKVPYVFKADTAHFLILVYDKSENGTSNINVRVSDFNTKMFESKNLNTLNILFEGNKFMVVVKTFDNKFEAEKYSVILNDNPEVFKDVNKSKIELFSITQTNLPLLLNARNTTDYQAFYKENYPK